MLLRTLWISGGVFLLDLISKRLVMASMTLGESISVLGSFFRLTYIHNPGAVFGWTLGGQYVHLIAASIALVLVAVMLWRLPPGQRLASVGLALVLGGAIGNVVDRIQFGEVIDFLDFGLGSVRWWIFNVADACVTIGAGLLVVSYSFSKDEEDETAGG